MYYILYRLDNLKVVHYDTEPLKPQLDIYGKAEYYGNIPKNDWLTVDNIRKEIDESSKTHIVCDLVAHFYPKRELTEEQKARQEATARIKVLKEQLTETDYQAIKYAEGWLSKEEYAPIKTQRQAWRDEINQLEKLL